MTLCTLDDTIRMGSVFDYKDSNLAAMQGLERFALCDRLLTVFSCEMHGPHR